MAMGFSKIPLMSFPMPASRRVTYPGWLAVVSDLMFSRGTNIQGEVLPFDCLKCWLSLRISATSALSRPRSAEDVSGFSSSRVAAGVTAASATDPGRNKRDEIACQEAAKLLIPNQHSATLHC